MNGYKVEPTTVDTAGADLRAASEAIAGHTRTLAGASSALRTLWTGSASDAFGSAQDGWQAEIHGMVTAAGLLSTALQESADAYERADRAVARAWSI